MNSVPQHLSPEDRQEYERLLDEALRSAPPRPEPAPAGQRLTTEQLRTLALNATALITAAAATEYAHYVKVREELRRPAQAAAAPASRTAGTEEPETGAAQLAATMGEVAEATGAGAVAVVAVLAPVLAGTAAAIFLLVGYVLRVLAPDQVFAQTLLTTGWVFGAVTALAILVATAGLLMTALRNRPSAETARHADPNGELARARDAWHDALLHRGFLPFLREALDDPRTATVLHAGPAAQSGRMPQLGYGRPGFSSPGEGATADHRPRYSSPDFSSPDFGGPEHQPE